MEKLIIKNRSDLPMETVLTLAREVVKQGRISNDEKQYCYLSVYLVNNHEYHIASDLNKKSDRLVCYRVPEKSKGGIIIE